MRCHLMSKKIKKQARTTAQDKRKLRNALNTAAFAQTIKAFAQNAKVELECAEVTKDVQT